MKSIVFFNNKVGVGKTTLACNIASHLASEGKQRILLVDCDPQCNSTQLILDSSEWSGIYFNQGASGSKTILDAINPIIEGEATIDISIEPILSSGNRFQVDLLAGHPRMAIVEDLLSKQWSEGCGGDLGGIRKSNWVRELTENYAKRYDLIIFDVGPSLGSLNRTVLLGTDYFLTPMGADIFSIFGIRNIAEWLKDWIQSYKVGLELCDRSKFPGKLETFGIDAMNLRQPGFIGYTVQQYITKSTKGERRPTQAFERILQQIPDQIDTSLGSYLAPHLKANAAKLGDVPNMFSLIPLAQSVNSPISGLQAADGLAGGQYQQQTNYVETIKKVTSALSINLESARGDLK